MSSKLAGCYDSVTGDLLGVIQMPKAIEVKNHFGTVSDYRLISPQVIYSKYYILAINKESMQYANAHCPTQWEVDITIPMANLTQNRKVLLSIHTATLI